jgi:hypothetical protein
MCASLPCSLAALFILNLERNKQQKQAMPIEKTQGMMDSDSIDIISSSWDFKTPANHITRKLQGPAGVDDGVGKEEPIEPSRLDQIMQIVFCSVFFILVWYVW